MISDKLSSFESLMKTFPKVAIAYSGGVDSSLLVKLSADLLGSSNVIAITGISQTYTDAEKKIAQQITDSCNVELVLLETDELASESFSSNPENRCYYCKKELYEKLCGIAKEKGISHIIDGTNADDLNDYRPGRKAAEEYGIISPFVLSGITKEEIRDLSRKHNLPTWDKPANPCLASRIPYGIRITDSRLRTIEQGEIFLRSLGLKNVRLRHHETVARIEVNASDLHIIISGENRLNIVKYLKSLGYKWVTLDIEGYRTGSLNE